MARRHFVVELDDTIKHEAVARLSTASSDGSKLLRDAGYIQGLIAARDLLKDIEAANRKDDEKD